MALKVGELFATLNLATGDFTKGLGKAQSLFKKTGLLIAEMGADAARSMVNIGMSFESAMSDVQAISGATGDELRKLRDTAKEYGSTTAFTATESAEALKYMALAGWDATQSMEALPGVLDMAAASGMDLAAASDAVTDYISAFGLEAKDATYMADAMAKAQSTANTSAQQLAEAWGNSAASMHAAGQDMETTTATLMVFADQGMKGSEAGTALTAMMRDITQNMENGAIKIGKASVAVKDAQGNFRDLNDIMVDVAKATEGMGSAEKSAALMTTFTARSIKGVNMMLSAGVDQLNEYEEAVRNSAGTASEQAATMLDNLRGDITIFNSALEGLQLDMFETSDSILRDAVQGATEIVNSFQEVVQSGFATDSIAEAIEKSFDFLTDIGDKIGDGAMKILSGFARVLPTISKGLQSGLKRMLAGLRKSLPGMLKGLFKALPGMLRGFILDVLPELTEGAFELLANLAENIVASLPDILPILIDGVIRLAPKILEGVGRVVAGIGKSIANMFGRGFDAADLLDAMLDSANQDYVADVKAQIDGELEYSPLIGKVEGAITAVQEALEGIEVSDDVKTAIETAVQTGSGIDLLTQTLISMGADATSAANIAQNKIASAMAKINAAYLGLGLSDEARNAIQTLAAEGGTKDEIADALKSFGVDETVAQEVAQTVIDANTTVNGALDGLGIDSTTKSKLLASIGTNSSLIAICMAALRVPQDAIDTILASYDSVQNDLGGRLQNVFQEIYDSLTDGKEDDSGVVAQLEQEVRGIYAEAVKKIEGWRDEEMAKLDPASVTYSTDVAEIEKKAQEMTSSLGTQEQAALAFITSMTNMSTDAVRQHKGELDQILADTKSIIAELEQLTSQTSIEFKAFNLVSSGLTTNAQTVGRAMDYAYAELLKYQTEAIEKYGTAIEEATKAGDADAINRIAAEQKAFEAEYQELYNSRLAEIFKGIAKQTIDPGILSEIEQNVQRMDLFGNVADWIIHGAEKSETPPGLESVLRDWFKGANIYGDIDEIWQQVQEEGLEALGSNAGSFGDYVYQIWQDAIDNTDEIFKNNDFDFTELASAIQTAIDAGLFENSELFKDLDANSIQKLFAAIFSTPIKDGVQQAAEEVQEDVAEAVEEAMSGEFTGPEPMPIVVDVPIEASAEVSEMTVETGDESAIEEAARTELEKQNLQIPISAEVSLTVSVADSNAAAVGAAAGSELGSALAAGITATSAETSAAAGGLANAAWAAISKATGKATSSGMFFAQGFATGIRTGKTSVSQAARELAQAAVNGLQEGIKQGSPSKITLESGKFFAEGFGLGILKEMRFVRDAVSSMADTAIESLSVLKASKMGFGAQLSSAGDSIYRNTSGASSALYGAVETLARSNKPTPIDYDRLADAMNERQMVLEQDGWVTARVSSRDNARAYNGYNRRVKLGQGR